MSRRVLAICVAGIALSFVANAQLPPDAVHLGRVKIPEAQKSADLDPVTLEAADANLPTWEHDGVTYGSSKADSKDAFMKDPAKFASAHEKQRWENNFVTAMSVIWCPVTDEISAGGGLIWDKLGVKWESCCQFCNDTKTDEDFPRALTKLKERAGNSFELTKGVYVNDASSPVEGAIDFGSGFPDDEPEGDAAIQVASFKPAWLDGQDLKPTLGEGVGLIFENRCVECHRDGGVAPMKFLSHGQIRQWTKNMKDVLSMRTMPPWPAGGHGDFRSSKRLSQEELDLVLAWIDAGYPKGEGAYEPAKRWGGDWAIGTPDHVFELGEHTLAEDASEHVAEYTIKTNFDEDKYIVSTEVQPTDTFLTFAIEAGPLGSFHPGNSITNLADGQAYLLKKGEEVKVRVFYTKEEGWEEVDDSTKFGVKFTDRPAAVTKNVWRERLANDKFVLAAGNKEAKATSEFTFPAAGYVIGLTPVMRERGRSLRAVAVAPDGTETELLNIGYWDPAWQFTYELTEPLKVAKGTSVRLEAVYDNSEDNNRNPDASADVKAGPGGELLEGWLSYSFNN